MRIRFWPAVDAVAHFLYVPTMGGRRSARTRWHHRIHLIPGALLSLICDAYEARLSEVEFDEMWRSGEPVQVVGRDNEFEEESDEPS